MVAFSVGAGDSSLECHGNSPPCLVLDRGAGAEVRQGAPSITYLNPIFAWTKQTCALIALQTQNYLSQDTEHTGLHGHSWAKTSTDHIFPVLVLGVDKWRRRYLMGKAYAIVGTSRHVSRSFAARM